VTFIPETSESVVAMTARGHKSAAAMVLATAQEHGYSVAAGNGGSFRMVRSYRPRWATVVSILFLPLLGVGLLFRFVKRTDNAVATIFEDREGTKVRVVGDVPPSFAAALAVSQPAFSETALRKPSTNGTSVSPKIGSGSSDTPTTIIDTVPAQQPRVKVASAGPEDRTIARSELGVTVSKLPPPNGTCLHLVLSDGQRTSIGSGLLIGRSPSTPQGWPKMQDLILLDPSVSKTHAAVTVTSDGIEITDLHSTNGTGICSDGMLVPLGSGTRVAVPEGAQIMVGDVVLTVEGKFPS